MAYPEPQKSLSYADYLSWDEGVLCEVIDGAIISMPPSPTPLHQDIADELTAEFKIFLRDKNYRAFSAPIDVCLPIKKLKMLILKTGSSLT